MSKVSQSKPDSVVAANPSPRSRLRRSRSSTVKEDWLIELFATNMRTLRTYRGLSQEELGDLCDLDRTYVSDVELKKRNITLRTIQRIAEGLRVDVRLLFTRELKQQEVEALSAR